MLSTRSMLELLTKTDAALCDLAFIGSGGDEGREVKGDLDRKEERRMGQPSLDQA